MALVNGNESLTWFRPWNFPSLLKWESLKTFPFWVVSDRVCQGCSGKRLSQCGLKLFLVLAQGVMFGVIRREVFPGWGRVHIFRMAGSWKLVIEPWSPLWGCLNLFCTRLQVVQSSREDAEEGPSALLAWWFPWGFCCLPGRYALLCGGGARVLLPRATYLLYGLKI